MTIGWHYDTATLENVYTLDGEVVARYSMEEWALLREHVWDDCRGQAQRGDIIRLHRDDSGDQPTVVPVREVRTGNDSTRGGTKPDVPGLPDDSVRRDPQRQESKA